MLTLRLSPHMIKYGNVEGLRHMDMEMGNIDNRTFQKNVHMLCLDKYWPLLTVSIDRCTQKIFYLMRCIEIAAGSYTSIVCEDLDDSNSNEKTSFGGARENKAWDV